MPGYLAHGFPIDCPWTLPDGVLLDSGPAELSGISVHEGRVAWEPDQNGPREQYYQEGGTSYFFWSIFGKASVDSRGVVVLEPRSDAPSGIVAHALLGPICAHWILMNGRIPLHANCVSIDGELVAIVGPSGAGKSSLAAALVAAGADPHADDVTSIQPRTAQVPFGAARIKLNPDVTRTLALPALGDSVVYEGLDKRSVHFAFPRAVSSRPLRAIYRLCDTDGSLEVIEVAKFPMAAAIVTEFYRPHVAESSIGLQGMLDRAASLVGQVRFFELHRRKELSRLPRLADDLIHHFQSLPRGGRRERDGSRR